MDVIVFPDVSSDRADSSWGLPPGPMRSITHPSGRPWIRGAWTDEEEHVAPMATGMLVLLGSADVTADQLAAEARRIRQFSDANSLYERIAGAYLTFLMIGDQFRMNGTLSTTHQFVYTTRTGYTVASNKADILRRAIGSSLQEDHLPLLLLAPRKPWPYSEIPAWQAIEGVPSTHALRIRANGQQSIERRWEVPTEKQPLSEIAPLLKTALSRAVSARIRPGRRISSDLSGGMDSTTLAFFAHENADNLLTVRQAARDVTNDDAHWAGIAHRHLPRATHLVVDAADAVPWYEDWDTVSDNDLSEPYPALRTVATTRNLARLVRSHGATTHINGLGGDELFSPSFAHLHALFRSAPSASWGAIQRARAMGRWGLAESFIGLTGSPTWRRWARRTATSLSMPSTMSPRLQWEPESRMPDWALTSTLDSARELLEEAATIYSASNDSVVDFEMLRLVVADGNLVRRMSQLMQLEGVKYESPYLDDQIIDLAFRVRFEDRVVDGRYKPVLHAAATGLVPAEVLGRRSKGDYSAEAYAGVAANRGSMARAFEDSALAGAKMIDPAVFTGFLGGIHPDTRPFRFIDPTLAVEIWLRRVSGQHDATQHQRLGATV